MNSFLKRGQNRSDNDHRITNFYLSNNLSLVNGLKYMIRYTNVQTQGISSKMTDDFSYIGITCLQLTIPSSGRLPCQIPVRLLFSLWSVVSKESTALVIKCVEGNV